MKPSISVLITCLLIFMGCESNSENSDFELTGTWIEQAEKLDTINFTTFGSEIALDLRRGSEFSSGYWLPKYGSGYYAYEIMGSDSIALCYFLSSACIYGVPTSYKRYYFEKVKENTFDISNFYNPDKSSEAIFTFSRIE